MTLYIKNMVCDRCIMVVKQQLENLGFRVDSIVLGSAVVQPGPDAIQLSAISSALKLLGFELIDNEKDRVVQRIKDLIIEKIHHSDLSDSHLSFSDYLSDQLHKDYTYLSRMFSESEDTTIEKFIIQQKIEKVKELLEYGELNINEIAWKMGYSSSAHLSAQFKTITGLTPSQFKASGHRQRKAIDKI
ncbi:helix-turn-helix domain-containing protein [Mucilaginibacter sp. HC2]|uniref:helix-turn-helix domain-containing protein n=1 Tax=Mucilaginibacter TaxID=423349 RepID=UPI000DCD67F5|nr:MULTISPECIES: helix-turn-helix domain-containing protein [Mucilaginibacter]NHA05531.1 helix-turn-helix domain-containing protein [Mucilaginibacter inviolabilis]QTE35339.1 helix-turn-helix domain-containing protein [Mucilaginibacter gossypii]RAV59458.1 AraC family transcriptional regulator [Mucilaginibacter rubeus]